MFLRLLSITVGLAAFLVSALPVSAAIARTDVSDIASNSGAGTTLSITNLTVGSGSDRFVWCHVGTDIPADLSPTASWSGGGSAQSMTLHHQHESGGRGFYVFTLDDPNTETNGTVTVSSTSATQAEFGYCVSWSGVASVDALSVVATGTNTTCTSNAVTSAAGDLAIGLVTTDGDESANFAVTDTGNAVIAGTAGACSGTACSGAGAEDAGGGSETFIWTWTGSRSFSCGAFNMVQAGAAASAPPNKDMTVRFSGGR